MKSALIRVPSLITLTTDFGDTAPYVAVMKGVILSVNPAARVLDLSHHIRPQDLRHANYFLGTALPFFPPGTVHVAVIDPGVGGDRAALCAEAGGQVLLAPDNGILTDLLRRLGEPIRVRHLTNPAFRRQPVSDTFHGRDVFAPAAAHLSLGVRPDELGPAVAAWVELPSRSAVKTGNRWAGEVQFIDAFGNLITNIPWSGEQSSRHAPRAVLALGTRSAPATLAHHLPLVRAYSDAAPGELVYLCSSDGFVEIAVVNGNAAVRLAAAVGTPVEIEMG